MSPIWDKVFKNGPSKIYGRQPLESLKIKLYFEWNIYVEIEVALKNAVAIVVQYENFHHAWNDVVWPFDIDVWGRPSVSAVKNCKLKDQYWYFISSPKTILKSFYN